MLRGVGCGIRCELHADAHLSHVGAFAGHARGMVGPFVRTFVSPGGAIRVSARCAAAPTAADCARLLVMEAADAQSRALFLLVRSGGRLYGLPLAHVIETMRPLPCEALPDAPPFVLGASVIRGAPRAVVDLSALLGVTRPDRVERWVLVRAGDGADDGVVPAVALAVEAVVRIVRLPASEMSPVSTLLADVREDVARAVTTHDGGLLTILDAARAIPPELGARLATLTASPVNAG